MFSFICSIYFAIGIRVNFVFFLFLCRLFRETLDDTKSDREYSELTPVEMAKLNGIQPCDKETNSFYCRSCLNVSDPDHMIICTDSKHCNDDNVRIMRNKAIQALKPENFEVLDDFEEEEKMYRVEHCGQAFHIYCVTYPDQIWLRWCNYMKLINFTLFSLN